MIRGQGQSLVIVALPQHLKGCFGYFYLLWVQTVDEAGAVRVGLGSVWPKPNNWLK